MIIVRSVLEDFSISGVVKHCKSRFHDIHSFTKRNRKNSELGKTGWFDHISSFSGFRLSLKLMTEKMFEIFFKQSRIHIIYLGYSLLMLVRVCRTCIAKAKSTFAGKISATIEIAYPVKPSDLRCQHKNNFVISFLLLALYFSTFNPPPLVLSNTSLKFKWLNHSTWIIEKVEF